MKNAIQIFILHGRKGSVKIHEDINFIVPLAEKILVKYLGSTEYPIAKALLNMQKSRQSGCPRNRSKVLLYMGLR
jgi:hypothetical protein